MFFLYFRNNVAKAGVSQYMNLGRHKSGFFSKINPDILGMSASLLCAVHCSALPLVLALGLLGGFSWLEHPLVEIGFIITSLMLAWLSLLPSWKSGHGRVEPLVVVFLGFFLIGLAHVLAESLEPVLMTLGGLSIAFAHFLNWRFMRKFGCQLAQG